jgi:N-hydroxyarylamine O-acetyltransferase
LRPEPLSRYRIDRVRTDVPEAATSHDHPVHLETYLERIGFDGSVEPSLTLLEKLHLKHLETIPFENIDVRLGRPIALDLEALQAKLVRRRRGGYCFEQNTLFGAVLGAIGFKVAALEARVRPPGATATLPRTHMALRVVIDSRGWLVDVGFGGDGPLLPVPLEGEMSEQPDGAYRAEPERDGFCVLRRRWRGVWLDLYAVSLTPALPVDFEVANYFTSTHPSSVFVKTLTVQRSTRQERRILRGCSYTVRRGEQEKHRDIAATALPGLLAGVFGLDLTDEEGRSLVETGREGAADPDEKAEVGETGSCPRCRRTPSGLSRNAMRRCR